MDEIDLAWAAYLRRKYGILFPISDDDDMENE